MDFREEKRIHICILQHLDAIKFHDRIHHIIRMRFGIAFHASVERIVLIGHTGLQELFLVRIDLI